MPVYTLRYVVFGTHPSHEWTKHQGAPWQRAVSSGNHGGVRSIHPRDVYMLTQLLNHVSKEQCSKRNIRKRGALGGESSLTGGCSGHWTGRGPGRGQGQGLKKKTPRPGPLTGAGRGIETGARRFRGPRGPVTNTRTGKGHRENIISGTSNFVVNDLEIITAGFQKINTKRPSTYVLVMRNQA